MAILPIVLFALLTALAVGGLAYAVLMPRIALEKNAASRLDQMKGAQTDAQSKQQARDRVQEVARRRRTLQASLKAVGDKQKQHASIAAHASLDKRIAQAGLAFGVRTFVIASIATGFVAFFVAILAGLSLFTALPCAVVAGYALPRFALAHLRNRRHKAFVEEFANAIDMIVRGIKSGLPLNDTLRMVANEAKEPARAEFRRVVEAQQLGMSTAEAVERLYQNMPMSETNFFSIVISIQAQAGGNLSEALGNLSRVLRDRKKMRAKIQAMSQEAKASGAIIGALPPIVALLVYLTTPAYLDPLFTTSTGNMLLLGAGIWMSMGILVMKKMIAFDF